MELKWEKFMKKLLILLVAIRYKCFWVSLDEDKAKKIF